MDSNGVLLLDIEDHFYYSLDRLGAQIWITIETSLSGIAFDGILDAIETHFDAPEISSQMTSGFDCNGCMP